MFKNQKGYMVIELLIAIVLIGMIFFINPFLWEYTIETWLEYAGKPQEVSFFMCILLGIFLPFPVVTALITWVSMLFLN